MKIAVFGASSPSGKRLVERALAEGHTLQALVRDPAKLEAREGLTVITGDAMDAAKVTATIAGSDAVISYLGPKKGAPKDMLEVSTQNIIDGMKQHGVKRVVIASVAGVAQPEDPKNTFGKVMGAILKVLLKNLFEQREKQLQLLRGSGLEWVAVRLPRLVDEPGTGDWRLGHPQMGPKLVVSRADLAEAMLKQLSDDTWVGKAPIIARNDAF